MLEARTPPIIPGYVANTLFGNIDQLVPANEAFLRDLQQMMSPDGPHTVGGVGDVALPPFQGSPSIRLLQELLCETRGGAGALQAGDFEEIVRRVCCFRRGG